MRVSQQPFKAGAGRAAHDLAPNRRVERAEEKDLVLQPQHRPTQVEAGVIILLLQQFAEFVGAREVVRLPARGLESLWPRVAVKRAVKLLAARLGDDIDDAALRLAILRLEAARLHLHLLDERRIDAHADRAEVAREDAEAAEGRVGDVDSVGYVKVIQRRSAGDRRVGDAALAAISHAGSQVEKAGDAALHGDILEELVVQVLPYRRTSRVNRGRARRDFDNLADSAGLE